MRNTKKCHQKADRFCVHKTKNCVHKKSRLNRRGGIIASLGVILLIGLGVCLIPKNLAKAENCENELTLEKVAECTDEKYKEEFLRLYREKADELMTSLESCTRGVVEIYTEFLDGIDAERFPELIADLINRALERSVGQDYKEQILTAAETLYKITPSAESARLGLNASSYFKDTDKILEYERLLGTELNQSTNNCTLWLGPTTDNLVEAGDFRTRYLSAETSNLITLYDTERAYWKEPSNETSVSLFSKCESKGLNKIYHLALESLSGAPEVLYAGAEETARHLTLGLEVPRALESAKLLEEDEKSKTYEKSFQVSYCVDAAGSNCFDAEMPLKIKIYTDPTYFAASAVEVGEKKTTVGPTKAYLEKELKNIWVETETPVEINFYHNFYASIPIKEVSWLVERDFPSGAGGKKYTLEASQGTDEDYVKGATDLLNQEGMFYYQSGTSLRDYSKYPFLDSYQIRFHTPGIYQFCEAVTWIERNNNFTKVCANFKVSEKVKIEPTDKYKL